MKPIRFARSGLPRRSGVPRLHLWAAIALFAASLTNACKSDSFEDVPDTEETASYYLLLIAPTRETALARCIQAETVALSCSQDGGRQTGYLSAVSTNYQPASTSSDAATLCDQLIDARVFNSSTIYTYGARQCHFECNRQYWQSRRDSSLCTSSGTTTAIQAHRDCSPTLWRSNCTDTTFKNCLVDCFVNGTDTYFLPQGY
ncbi:MAG: hypothetical protein CMN76_10200 [Spirochaetaceae bacterium]|nr:hypothetical protein [Spirochaetaceae bacterium]|tara:strand:+ start:59011 stop:59616 length:606 start_codon:yes stop_codon:yes gene_type:complete